MTVILLFLLYTALFSWWLSRSSYFRIEGLHPFWVYAAFGAKLLMGVLYGYIHWHFFNGKDSDTWIYLSESRVIYESIGVYPDYYWQAITGQQPIPPAPQDQVFHYPAAHFFWTDPGPYMLVHLHALLFPLTRGDYPLHIFFIAILGLSASINFYRSFRRQFDIPAPLLAAVCFFLPSLLFWTSGLHKDIFAFYGISLVLLAITDERRSRIGLLAAGLAVLAAFRYYLLLPLLPAIAAYYMVAQQRDRAVWKPFVVTYGLTFGIVVVFQGLGAPILEALVQLQLEFSSEQGASTLPVVPLQANFFSLLLSLPQALLQVFIHPLPWEVRYAWQLTASIETMGILLLLAFQLTFARWSQWQRPLVPFVCFFVLSHTALVGLLVSNVGTIVRYRSIALALLVIVILQGIDYLRLRRPALPPPPARNKEKTQELSQLNP